MVKIVINGLDYSIRKMLVKHQFLDMAQLTERVRQIKQLRAKKEIIRKVIRKEWVTYLAYVELEEEDDDQEALVAELQSWPPYICPSLRPAHKGKEKPLLIQRVILSV